MNGKDFTSGFFIRKTDKEDFVKPSLPQQFRRQGFNVIGGGYEKDRLFVFLHPRVSSVANIRLLNPPSLLSSWRRMLPSISSIQRMAGDIASI